MMSSFCCIKAELDQQIELAAIERLIGGAL